MAYKQHFVEWFSGKSLPSYWTQNITNGSLAMADEVDGGVLLSNDAVSWKRVSINFNDKRQYAHDGSVSIGIVKRNTTNSISMFGFSSGDTHGSLIQGCLYFDDSTETYKQLNTGNGSSGSSTVSDVAVSTDWTSVKTELDATNAYLSLGGVLKVTKSTLHPISKMQPICMNYGRASATASSSSFRYMEAYNT
tara:strand:- start:26 stop:604 length:579 start_codon:yes stop_codon:yes gene_type:complete